MKHLSELIELLGPHYILLCPNDSRSGKAQEALFNFLRSHPDATSGAAAAALELESSSSAFRKVKHGLKIELLNAATRIGVSERSTNKRKRTFAYVWKLISIAKQLRTSVTSEVLLPFLEEAYTISADANFIDAAYESAVMLRRQYNNRKFDPAKYEYYRNRALEYRDISRKYQDAVADLNELSYLRNLQRDPAEIKSTAARFYAKHAPAIEDFDLAMISYIVFLIELNLHLADRDYPQVIRVANKAIAYLSAKESAQPTMFQVFEVNLSVAYTQLNDFENGMAFAHSLLSRTLPGEHNYLKVYELMLLLCLRSGKFQESYALYRSMELDSLRRIHAAHLEDTFRIIEAYLYLLHKLKQVQLAPDDDHFDRFQLSRFLNSVEHVSNEKSHRNVHLLILQIVDQVIRHRHTQTRYSIEAITKYAQRHLKGPGHERVRYFLKALAQLSEQAFHRSAVERHTRRYFQLMEKHPVAKSSQAYYMELVPFEVLWTLILSQLGYRRVRQWKSDPRQP